MSDADNECFFQRKTEGQQLKGKIVAALFTLFHTFHSFPHFLTLLPQVFLLKSSLFIGE